ncbi:MAG: C-GCAxxG-C-C family (seleno)protein [Candidatus Heteroscillospira sp.]|jgi:C_GCAxxG_C_C family probable redox protein
MLRDRAYKYYIENGMNCAEAMLLGANEEYELGLSPESAKLLGGFGGGISSGNVCGALAGSVAVIGQLLIEQDAHTTQGFKEACKEFVAAFEAKLGDTRCCVLKEKNNRTDGYRCMATVDAACEVLEDFVRARRVGVPVTAEQKAAVKALGFLHDKNTPDRFNARVITVNGKITSEQARALADAAEKFGTGEVAMTTRLTVEVQGIPYANIQAFIDYLAPYGLEPGGTGSLVRPVVSCKGTTCQYGNIDTFALSREIHQRFYKGYRGVKLPHKFKIAVGGCPNNCVKPDLNDLGIVGQHVPTLDADKCRGCAKCQIAESCPIKSASVIDGKLDFGADCNRCGRCIGKCPFHAVDEGTYGYRVYIGGRWGKKVARGTPLSPVFTDKEEVLKVIEKAILLFRDQGITGERFNDTVNRLGFAEVERQLLSDELLERKDEIIGATKHTKGGATC